ncbi:adenylate/guanylate cyclase domain-containing protein [uncultured Shimia sp.]|uniref:adenylate/guanylate cyclase domain-containing protein n=1 Tax=uncultured Shimia sp. TaxID=573152 RepID=UPI0026093352|nr:adenylate/guanylate cyclase domain-containing protein [uncultured Shimia sp.]
MTWNRQDITSWLLREGPGMPHLEALTYALADKLSEVGVPLWRLRIAMRTTHPLVTAISTIWERETGPQEVFVSPHGLEQRSSFAGSPMARISQTRAPVRQDLSALTPDHHLAFHELRERGATDYLGLPLIYGDHLSGLLVAVSDAPDGFSQIDVDGLLAITPVVSTLVEVRRLTVLSKAVATAYLGPLTGQRVLGGDITRGHVDHLDAAILVSDLRGWTQLNTERRVEETVAIANAYFDILDDAVRAHGGEILKFMGDGVLAVFPVTEARSGAARNAVAAAQQALAQQDGDIQFGIGLHIGNVLYGNTGSERRLDFTVLGPAVNLAARIEALCSETDQSLLVSAEMSGLLEEPSLQVGEFALKGLPGMTPVFAPSSRG